jgi:ribosomal protein L32E
VALAKQEASGLSPSAFAKQEGLEVQRLYRWRQRLAKEAGRRAIVAATPTFVEVRTRRAERVEVVLPSGRVVRVSEDIDGAVLLRLVVALERAEPC